MLGVVTQTFEARSDFGVIFLTFLTLAPFLCSLCVVDSVRLQHNRRWIEKVLARLVTIYTVDSCFFSLYRIGRKFSFDLFWFWYNLTDAYRTLIALDERLPDCSVVATSLTLRLPLVCIRSASACPRWPVQCVDYVTRLQLFALCYGPMELPALLRQGRLHSSFHLLDHPSGMSSITTRANNQFPRPTPAGQATV
jgi:hypothetical protein